MPTTTNKALPYPVTTDTPDVPRDVLALANRVDVLLAAVEQTGAVDLNTLVKSGTYYCAPSANGPVPGSEVYLTVDNLVPGFVRQIASTNVAGVLNSWWYRTEYSGTWSQWRQLTSGARASGVAAPVLTAGVGSATVTFTTGLFTAAPVVTAMIVNGAGTLSAAIVRASAVSASAVTLVVSNGSTHAGAVNVHWTAIQEAP